MANSQKTLTKLVARCKIELHNESEMQSNTLTVQFKNKVALAAPVLVVISIIWIHI